MNKKVTVRVQSPKKFSIAINNAYMAEQRKILGQAELVDIQDPADVRSREYKVRGVTVSINEKYDDYVYAGTLEEQSDFIFFEEPFPTEGPGALDINKKLNHHFKHFKKGSNVPIEYILWRFAYTKKNLFSEGLLSMYVTKDNYHKIQWLLHALYSDSKQEYALVTETLINGLYARLLGEKSLVKKPKEIVNTTVGEFNIAEVNKDYIKANIESLNKQKAALEQLLQTNKELVAEPRRVTEVESKVAESLIDDEDIEDVFNRGIESQALEVKGAWIKFGDQTIGKGRTEAIIALKNAPELRERVKAATEDKLAVA